MVAVFADRIVTISVEFSPTGGGWCGGRFSSVAIRLDRGGYFESTAYTSVFKIRTRGVVLVVYDDCGTEIDRRYKPPRFDVCPNGPDTQESRALL